MSRRVAPARGPRPASASGAATAPAGLVRLGEVGRPHGLKGEVRLKSYTADPAAIAAYGPLVAEDGRRITIRAVRPSGAAPDLLVARIEGVGDRTAAEGLARLALYAPRDRLGRPEDEDEFFAADLVGLDVVDAAGRAIGTVVAVPNYGGGDLLEIRPASGGATALLPFLKSFVPAVDLAAGRVTVAAPDDLFAPARPGPEA